MVTDFFWNEGDFYLGDEIRINDDEADVRIQFWEANSNTSEDSKKYWKLTTENKPFHRTGLSSYSRKQSVCRTIILQDDDDGGGDYEHKLQKSNRLQILISRVFRNKRPETAIYARHKQKASGDASFGMGYCLYIPVYKTPGDYYSGGSPCGVMEYVSTHDLHFEKFRIYLGLLPIWSQERNDKKKKSLQEMYMYGDHLYGLGRLNILEHAVLEMDQFLTVVCQKFPLPLAQYWVTTDHHKFTFPFANFWVTTDHHKEPLRVIYQQSHTEMKNLNFLDKFKQACMEMRLSIDDEGLVGTAYRSRKTFFCNNIKELSITNQHLAQYASYNMSIPCFIICLKGIFPESRDCVLEFFLPPQEILSTYNHQDLLNSLLATMKDHLPSFMIASGERLGQVLKVEVIDSSMHNEPRFLKLGEWNSSLPHHEYEGVPSHELSHLLKSLFEEDEHIVDIRSTTNSCNETATGETSERAPACHNIAETIHLDKLEEESSIKCNEPQSLTFKSKRTKEDLINEGNTEEIDQSAPETTLEVAIKQKEHTVAADTVDELVEEPPIVDIGHNMDVRYTMNTASQISNFEPTISFPQQVEEETMVLDTLAQNSRNILVTENDDTTIPVVNKTCQEVHTSKREIKPPEISFASLEEHFGRPLDDAAASFGVSRSTLKRRCRDLGIKKWRAGKRTRSDNISSNLKRKINDEEPSRVSGSGMPSSQDIVVAHTSQRLNKMTVKATYNKVTIRFELSDLSRLAELEDNVIKRLHLEKKSFSIHYQDDVDEWMLISCDEDVQQCMEVSRSSKKTTIKMKIDEPINNHAP